MPGFPPKGIGVQMLAPRSSRSFVDWADNPRIARAPPPAPPSPPPPVGVPKQFASAITLGGQYGSSHSGGQGIDSTTMVSFPSQATEVSVSDVARPKPESPKAPANPHLVDLAVVPIRSASGECRPWSVPGESTVAVAARGARFVLQYPPR